MTDNSTNQKTCPECNGAGSYQDEIMNGEHEGELTTVSCYNCNSTGRIQSDTPKKMMLKQDGDMLYAFDPDSFVRDTPEPDTKDGLEVLRNNQMIQDWLRDPVVGYFSSSAAEIVRNLLEEK